MAAGGRTWRDLLLLSHRDDLPSRATRPSRALGESQATPYEKGLLAAQLVHSLNLFGRITQSAVREHDGEDVLQ